MIARPSVNQASTDALYQFHVPLEMTGHAGNGLWPRCSPYLLWSQNRSGCSSVLHARMTDVHDSARYETKSWAGNISKRDGWHISSAKPCSRISDIGSIPHNFKRLARRTSPFDCSKLSTRVCAGGARPLSVIFAGVRWTVPSSQDLSWNLPQFSNLSLSPKVSLVCQPQKFHRGPLTQARPTAATGMDG
jgi:hypothetical protein